MRVILIQSAIDLVLLSLLKQWPLLQSTNHRQVAPFAAALIIQVLNEPPRIAYFRSCSLVVGRQRAVNAAPGQREGSERAGFLLQHRQQVFQNGFELSPQHCVYTVVTHRRSRATSAPPTC